MKKLSKILYLIMGLSFLAIIMPLIFLQFDYIKTFALKTFHTRENAYGYLQFVGSFLGVVATISVTIILQEKQKYQKEQDDDKRAALNLYTQLDRGFKKYKEAQINNKMYIENDSEDNNYITASGPRKVFIDPNYIKDLAQLKSKLDDDLYENIGLSFDAIVNLYKYYLELEQELENIEKKDFDNYTESSLVEQSRLKKKSIKRIKLLIIDHVKFVCDLYEKEHKDNIEELIKLYK